MVYNRAVINQQRILVNITSFDMKTKKRKFISQKSLDRKHLRLVNKFIDDLWLNKD